MVFLLLETPNNKLSLEKLILYILALLPPLLISCNKSPFSILKILIKVPFSEVEATKVPFKFKAKYPIDDL